MVSATDTVVGLSAIRCDALRGVSGISSAGSVGRVERLESRTSPGINVYVMHASSGMAEIVYQRELPHAYDAAIGPKAASQLGVIDAGYVSLNDTIPLKVVPMSSARTLEWENRILIPSAAAGNVHTCFVESVPGSEQEVEALLNAWFTTPQPPIVGRLYVPDSPSFGGILISSLPAMACSVAFFLAFGVLAVQWRQRRSEFALYAACGFGRRYLLAMRTLETALLVVIPFIFGGAWCFIVSRLWLESDFVSGGALAYFAATCSALTLLPLIGFRMSPGHLTQYIKGR